MAEINLWSLKGQLITLVELTRLLLDRITSIQFFDVRFPLEFLKLNYMTVDKDTNNIY